MIKIKVANHIINEAYNIYKGAYSPVQGFLGKSDYQSVLDSMRLANGELWSIPIIIQIEKSQKDKVNGNAREGALRQLIIEGEQLELLSPDGSRVILVDVEVYKIDKQEYANKIFQTNDLSHPGVANLYADGDFALGGIVKSVERTSKIDRYISPQETKEYFAKNNWQTISAFQTRNAPHRGHEYLLEKALEQTDGLLIHPVIGEKKDGDFKDEYILGAYDLLLEKYFPKNRTLLAALPLKMRYAGPREAVMHALVRRNYGCSHFIVGRDHAGLGDYYKPLEAQELCAKLESEGLGIKILSFSPVAHNTKTNKACFVDDCDKNDTISFSGTKLRKHLQEKSEVPEYLIRPVVYNFLVNSKNLLISNMNNSKVKGEAREGGLGHKKNKGFTLWFTGLSAAGKTTIADRVFQMLKGGSINLERLDGDIVRENLAKGLSFSKADRDENIRRIGFVTNLLSRNGVGVIASFISPYKKQRDGLRDSVENFIEVFVDTSLDICESRDPKGMYKMARAGEIKEFTGVSDPYEVPENPDIHLSSGELSVDDCAEVVIDYLGKEGYLG